MVREVKVEMTITVKGPDLSDKKLTDYIQHSIVHIPYQQGFDIIDVDITKVQIVEN